MKKHGKGKILRLINLDEKEGVRKSIERLQKRYKYLLSKLGPYRQESNQMKYIKFHLRRLQKGYREGYR